MLPADLQFWGYNRYSVTTGSLNPALASRSAAAARCAFAPYSEQDAFRQAAADPSAFAGRKFLPDTLKRLT